MRFLVLISDHLVTPDSALDGTHVYCFNICLILISNLSHIPQTLVSCPYYSCQIDIFLIIVWSSYHVCPIITLQLSHYFQIFCFDFRDKLFEWNFIKSNNFIHFFKCHIFFKCIVIFCCKTLNCKCIDNCLYSLH